MSYQVLARKWRPANFREMVGQEHVLKALINALDHNRLHHAYLFTGTRGVGKTTIARILAKCLNCGAGVTSTPCGECSACIEISEGRFIDLIEVDAASRTKVEDTRELLDNVQYAPTRGRYKIYLIDEVHMLSNHSFNALLKTLEEPPEHVKFLLATTDPQKLPVTILSRCLQFNLKNMSSERIVGHLQHVLAQEAVPFEESALWLLARGADGSMRDALSLTDQAIAYGSGKIGETDVAAMLGTIDHQLIQNLMAGLIESDGKKILEAVAKFAEHAPDFNSALADLLTLLHRIAIAQALPEALDNSFGDRTQILDFASKLPAEDVQLFYQTALIGRRDINLAPEPRSGFEMTLLRMLAFKPQGVVDVPSQPLGSAQPSLAPSNAEGLASPKKPSTETAIKPEPVMRVSEAAVSGPIAPVNAPVSSAEIESNNPPLMACQLENAAITGVEFESVPAMPAATAPVLERPATPTKKLSPTDNLANILNEKSGVNPSRAERDNSVDIKAQLKAQVKAITGKEGIVAPKPVAMAAVTAASPVSAEHQSGVVAATKKSVENDRPEKIALEHLNPVSWVHVFRHLSIRGILQSTAANCVFLGAEQSHLFFALDENKGSLFDSSHSQRLGGMLSDYFQQSIKVDIHLQALPEGTETPAQCFEREKAENYAEALRLLANDPIVQTLQQEFGAVLDDQSVVYD
ncbi:DNA polymerase III subunit gamma/tau [Teredinibacter purpureus]|uniref:DNA polymerase III subunit gamma/tau n=1 Tax=Teredinibacter purpureus TaxID=2731756 RepID=UPI0005F7D11B|nr:DNA polymerase III subunit gamma/tau [Teredinibacter purpureus]